ncbi:uncharacterized protein LOC127865313 [Dreissena polymorpha]|uniref:Voltage-gated hydrogen channel 1 n=1 Tax=Dreissena polymorpha TaxID=45954 RepID=A0A9D4MGW2_DREPO|nr:uncharacterized protein LOC127865313 [Dreissena polymorpha]XP_052261277.1 uncharacterized protein LOC127865313 [Dreissena polymorpha]KAH3877115.1 hypothetical protein DPMN_000972 [Dreissena polymorpha]
MVFGKKKNSRGLAALAGGAARMAQHMIVLDKTEAALDREMKREEQRRVPKTKIGKARRKGEHLLHTKYVLLLVVILNVIDCLLVLGELMLDIKYVTDILTKEYKRSDDFIASMKLLYPYRLSYLESDDIEGLEREISIGHITWNASADSILNFNHRRKRRGSLDSNGTSNISNEDHGNKTFHKGQTSRHHGHSIEEDIAHGLHKASITILGILCVEVLFKIVCLGTELLQHKLECFDAFIVIASFIVDLVFLKGLQQFKVHEFVLILAFLVPWRLIRVVNSLIVAIMDHEHFRLVILYKQKKKTQKELQDAKDDITGLEACVDALEKLCEESGIPSALVQAKFNMYRKVKVKGNIIGAMSNFAIGGQLLCQPFTTGLKTGKQDKQMNGRNHDIQITVDDFSHPNKSDHFSQDKPAITELTDSALTVGSVSVADGTSPAQIRRAIYEDRVKMSPGLKPRSHSDTEREGNVARLTESSAGFLSTINADTEDLRQMVAHQKDNTEVTSSESKEKNLADDSSEMSNDSDLTGTDSCDSINKADTDTICKR